METERFTDYYSGSLLMIDKIITLIVTVDEDKLPTDGNSNKVCFTGKEPMKSPNNFLELNENEANGH